MYDTPFQNPIIVLLAVAIIIGIGAPTFILRRAGKKHDIYNLSLRCYVKGYGICAAISLGTMLVMVFAPGEWGWWILGYLAIFVPLMFFTLRLSKKLIREPRRRNMVVNFLYKLLAIVLIWCVALYPATMAGIGMLTELPAQNAKNQEFARLQEEIMDLETYADLRPFGLGVYKLQNDGDKYLWDVTQPSDNVREFEGYDMVFESHINRRGQGIWDIFRGNSNAGKNVYYDVVFYEGTYIIVAPAWEGRGYLGFWGVIYLTKSLDEESDIFEIGILDPEVAEKIRALSYEKISRKELSEKIGMMF